LLLGQLDCLVNRININFNVFSNYPYAGSRYPLVYTIRLFGFLRPPPKGSIETAWSAVAGIDII
jgi:hypothetical protein